MILSYIKIFKKIIKNNNNGNSYNKKLKIKNPNCSN